LGFPLQKTFGRTKIAFGFLLWRKHLGGQKMLLGSSFGKDIWEDKKMLLGFSFGENTFCVKDNGLS
jgi:hypothetical protein